MPTSETPQPILPTNPYTKSIPIFQVYSQKYILNSKITCRNIFQLHLDNFIMNTLIFNYEK